MEIDKASLREALRRILAVERDQTGALVRLVGEATATGRTGVKRESFIHIHLPRIDGENCHGRDKLAMLEAYFEQAGLPRESVHIRFFTDHPSDEPVLRWADESYVVNPRGQFRARAAAAGWPVLSWS